MMLRACGRNNLQLRETAMFKINSILPSLAGLCLLVADCGGVLFGDSGKFDDARKKVPLPPGNGPFEIHEDDATNFYINMTYSDGRNIFATKPLGIQVQLGLARIARES